MQKLLEKDDQAVERGGSAEALNMLLRMKQSIDNGEPPLSLSDRDEVYPYDGQMEEFSEVWESRPVAWSGQRRPPAEPPRAALGG